MEFKKEIGKGGGGVVRENTKGEAVKILPNIRPYRLTCTTTNEVTVSQMSLGPYVLQAKEVIVEKDETLVVMPKIPKTLSQVIHGRGLKNTPLFFFQIGLGLAALHNNGIVHNDIKENNVLVSPEGTPIIIDFGSIYWLYNVPESSLYGTYTYAPPESLMDEGISLKSDVWSFGVLLLLSVIKRRIFDSVEENHTPEGILRVIKARLPEVVDDPKITPFPGVRSLDKLLTSYKLEPKLVALIKRCLSRVDKRPTIFEVLDDPYFQEIEEERPLQLDQRDIKENHSSSLYLSPKEDTWKYTRLAYVVTLGRYSHEYILSSGAFLVAVDIMDYISNKETAHHLTQYAYISIIVAAAYYGINLRVNGLSREYFKRFSELFGWKFIPAPFIKAEDCPEPFDEDLMVLAMKEDYPTWSNEERANRYY